MNLTRDHGFEPGLIEIAFWSHWSVDDAATFIGELGLVVSSGFKKCGRGPNICAVVVEAGKEQEWIDKLMSHKTHVKSAWRVRLFC